MKNNTTDPTSKARVKSFPVRIIMFRKTILWTIVILTLSFLPGRTFEKVNLFDISFMDLIVHFCLYAVFTFLILREQSGKTGRQLTMKSWLMAPLIASAALGIITELVQWLLIAGRSGNFVDFFLDMCGSAAVLLLYPRIRL